MNKVKTTTFYFKLISIGIWISIIAISYQYNLKVAKDYERISALNGGRAFFRHIVLTRAWNASHGGVYVPVTDKIQPNPYLTGEDRDIVTTRGINLTKLNPAFMTRQISEMAENTENIELHITSISQLNPINKPKPWERSALYKFEMGDSEAGSFDQDGEKRKFRYIAPLKVTRECLDCHKHQGYEVGDIRGAISVTIPFPEKKKNFILLLSHIMAGLIGASGLFWLGGYVEKTSRHLTRLKNKAVDASETKGKFLATLSHEIRTSMNGAIGMSELLLETNLTKEQENYSRIISGNANALLFLLNDIMDYSKIESGKIQFESIGFDLLSMVENVCELMSANAHKKGIEIACLVNHDVPLSLKGDSRHLHQICTNLMKNAVKYTNIGQVSLSVSLVEESSKEVTLHFSIKYTGQGIGAAQKRLFQSYTQADSPTAKNFGGTGLGLSIATELIQMLGGKTGAESQAGKGSEFWFTLRFKKQFDHGAADRVTLSKHKIRLLIVDDTPMNSLIFNEYLKSMGNVEFDQVASSHKALKLMHHAEKLGKGYDIAVLADRPNQMLDGVGLGRAIKASKDLNKVRLIMISLLGQQGAQEIECHAHLTVPIIKKDLIDSILSAMEQPPACEKQPKKNSGNSFVGYPHWRR